MARTAVITPTEVINDMHRVYNTVGKLTVHTYRKHGLFSYATMRNVLGLEDSKKSTLEHVIKTIPAQKEDITKDTLKMLLRKTNKHFSQEGVPFKRDTFVKNSPISKHQLNRQFGSWTAAVHESGIA